MSFTPYNIQDWLRRTPAVPVRRRNTYIEIPAFNYTDLEWKGASECVAQFNFSASNKFTLITLPTKPTDANFGLCIRYRIGDEVFRFKLWDDEAFKLTGDVPVYTNEIIRANFVIEVWSYENETTALNEEALQTITSVRVLPTDVSQLGVNAALAVGAEFLTLENTNSTTIAVPSENLLYQFAADTGLVEAAGNVVSWANQLGETLLPVGGNVGYTASVPAINNKPIVTFASSAVSLENDNLTEDSFVSLALVFRQTSYTTGRNIVETLFNGGLLTDLLQEGSSPDIIYNQLVTNSSAGINDWVILYMDFTNNEAETEFYTNLNVYSVFTGLLVAAAQYSSASPHTPAVINGLKLGNASVAGALFMVAELLVYSADRDGQEADVVNYFSSKYGSVVPINLPLTFNSGVQWLDNDN